MVRILNEANQEDTTTTTTTTTTAATVKVMNSLSNGNGHPGGDGGHLKTLATCQESPVVDFSENNDSANNNNNNCIESKQPVVAAVAKESPKGLDQEDAVSSNGTNGHRSGDQALATSASVERDIISQGSLATEEETLKNGTATTTTTASFQTTAVEVAGNASIIEELKEDGERNKTESTEESTSSESVVDRSRGGESNGTAGADESVVEHMFPKRSSQKSSSSSSSTASNSFVETLKLIETETENTYPRIIIETVQDSGDDLDEDEYDEDTYLGIRPNTDSKYNSQLEKTDAKVLDDLNEDGDAGSSSKNEAQVDPKPEGTKAAAVAAQVVEKKVDKKDQVKLKALVSESDNKKRSSAKPESHHSSGGGHNRGRHHHHQQQHHHNNNNSSHSNPHHFLPHGIHASGLHHPIIHPLIPGLQIPSSRDMGLFGAYEPQNGLFGLGGLNPSGPGGSYEYYCDQKAEALMGGGGGGGWNSYGPSGSSPPPPTQQQQQQQQPSGQMSNGNGSQAPLAHLPMALFPLPLDPACPPAILPSPAMISGPGASTGGYQSAGSSRSSTPMQPQASSMHPHQGNGGQTSTVYSASSADNCLVPPFPVMPGQHVVFFHINPGVLVSFHVGGDHIQVIKGPMTVPLVSTGSTPPIPLPMQVPPGHLVQQIVDENGTLRQLLVSHQHPLMPIPFGPGSQSQPFYPPGPGYPSHFQPMQPGSVPHMPSAQAGPPTPPGHNSTNYGGQVPNFSHKDERAARQQAKLRKRWEQKQRELSKDGLNPVFYHQNGAGKRSENGGPRRGMHSSALKSNGLDLQEDGSTGSVTSTGTQDEEEDARIQIQADMLSAIVAPVVTEVTSQSALIQWTHPDRFTESGENKFPEVDVPDTDFLYEVSINEKSQDNHFTPIFKGKALSCRVKDLKPGTEYAICYAALLNDVRGNDSIPTAFTTLPDVPSIPAGLRQQNRTRNSIHVKWNAACDNGSKVTIYVLEYDEASGGEHFVECYRGKNKQHAISKLQPATEYQLRIAALNGCGQSDFSPVTTMMTAGCPPTQPNVPVMTEAGVTYLSLAWEVRPTDDEYTLQMEDPYSGHGFRNVYSQSAPHHTCIGLQRNTEYRFRLKAENVEGSSEWSEKVSFRTLADRPGPPNKPSLKGRVHSTGFRVRWEPRDNGGVPIESYLVEIDKGNGFEEIYRDIAPECTVDKLDPGQSYALRVRAINSAGISDPSDSCVITTDPVCPGKCHSPKVVGKPKSNSVQLKWSRPDSDGGSPVNCYEVGCTTPDNQTQEAYRGKETNCFVTSLLPGRAYLFQIRAINRIGAGPWSDPLEVVSGPGAPDAPPPVKVQSKTAHVVVISWAEPLNNGSAITEYRVQMATVTIEKPVEEEERQNSVEEEETLEIDEAEEISAAPKPSCDTPTTSPKTSSFSLVYSGATPSCEVKSLQPATYYLFKVQATNTAGTSDWSPVVTHQTPASTPGAVTNIEASADSDSVQLNWSEPQTNGSPITHYNVSVGEGVFSTSSTSYTVDNLMADTTYKIRVHAVNAMGAGPSSSAVKISTKPLPPQPPTVECVGSLHNWMKLKWNETASKNVEYLIQMRSPYQDEFQVVYRGSGTNHKVTKLNEDTTYSFRICAFNAAGQGPFSDWYNFTTQKAPPAAVKSLKLEKTLNSTHLKAEWAPVPSTDEISYRLQMARRKENEFQTVYLGKENTYQVDASELDEGADYGFRVCAIRHIGPGSESTGPYSSIVNIKAPEGPSRTSEGGENAVASPDGNTAMLLSTYRTLQEAYSCVNMETKVAIGGVLAFVIISLLCSSLMHIFVS